MNTSIFGTSRKSPPPPADTINEAGGKAYALPNEAALANLAVTGTFNDQFYIDGERQLEMLINLSRPLSDEFIAKCAVYAREHGLMKDMPAALVAILAGRKTEASRYYLDLVFPRVIDSGKMLRNFVQMIRSGHFGRKSLGNQPRRLVAGWFLSRRPDQVFRQSVGDKPSMADVIRLSRPKPRTEEQRALFGYLIGAKDVNRSHLPELVSWLEAFRNGETANVPSVPWEMLTSTTLTPTQWQRIALNASWTQLRMNLNNFQRHGCWNNAEVLAYAAAKLADPDEVRRSRCFPFQLLAAFTYADDSVPIELRNALQDAMEIACENIPTIEGKLHVYPDVSGSMSGSISGARGSATSKIRCVDAAALISAAFMRKNPTTTVIPFDTRAHSTDSINPRDSIMTNAARLARFGGGGTDCSAPVRYAIAHNMVPDVAIFLSDNESWFNDGRGGQVKAAQEWRAVQQRNPYAKLICVNLASSPTTQVKGDRVLNIGGFSDANFQLIADFASGALTQTDLVASVRAVQLDVVGVTSG